MLTYQANTQSAKKGDLVKCCDPFECDFDNFILHSLFNLKFQLVIMLADFPEVSLAVEDAVPTYSICNKFKCHAVVIYSTHTEKEKTIDNACEGS